MNKKIVIISITSLLLLIILFGTSAYLGSRAGSEDFVVSEGVLTKYTGLDEEVIIPSEVEVIGSSAFSGNSNLKKVTIPASVTKIESEAFSNCISLTTVDIGDSVIDIGSSAFLGCSKLSEVNIGKGLRNLREGAFADCDSLSRINIASDQYIYDSGAIYDKNYKKLYQYLAGYPGNVFRLNQNVEDISAYAFWGADALEEVYISASLTKLNDYALANCKNLKSVVMYSPLRELGLGAFYGDENLRQLVFPESMGKIHNQALDGCPEDLVFVCEKGSYSENFANDNGYLVNDSRIIEIDEVLVPPEPSNLSNSLSSNSTGKYDMVDDFFADENPNSTDYIDNKTEISENLFYDTLSEISESRIVSDRVFVSIGDLKPVDGIDYTIVDKSKDGFSHYGEELKSTDIPEGAIAIERFAYARSAIETAIIPEGVETIGYAAFYHCDNLTEVTIPSTVKNIEKYAFDYTPWYENWRNNEEASDFLIVGDGVLIGYKGSAPTAEEADIPEEVKVIAEGVFEKP